MEKENTYGYYSKVLNKPFDTLEDLKKAEFAHKTEQLKKEKAALARKQDASEVEVAFKKLNEAKKNYNTKRTTACSAYYDAVKAARKAYEDVLDTLDKELSEADAEYNKVLKNFTAKYPGGYHFTVTDGDNTATYTKSTHKDSADYSFDDIAEFVRTLFK